MRIMAVDYGDAHTGVALSDPTGFLAGTTTTIHSRKTEVVLEELSKLVREYQVEELVMGFPKNMDGTEGPRAEKSRALAELTKKSGGALAAERYEKFRKLGAGARKEDV